MRVVEVALLGIIQGILEWLPISSSGQLIYFMLKVFNVSVEEAYNLSLFLHVGTALAVIVRYRNTYVKVVKCAFSFNCWRENKLLQFIAIVIASSALTALPLYIILTKSLSAIPGDIVTFIIGVLLVLSGLLMITFRSRSRGKSLDDINVKDMVLIGLITGFSIIPGISRSGISVAMLLYYGFSPVSALELSFIVGGIMTFIGGLLNLGSLSLSVPLIVLAIVIPFILGYMVISVLLRIARKLNFSYFAMFIGILMILSSLPYTSLLPG